MATGVRDLSSTPDLTSPTCPAAPTAEDSWARWASGAVGGPPGEHAARHPRLTALVMALAVCAATFTVGLLHLAPCAAGSWFDPPEQYADQCWSAHPYDYTTGGLAERTPPLQDAGGRFAPPVESPTVAVAAYGAALVTSAVSGWPDADARGERPLTEVAAAPEVKAEAVTYTGVVALLLLAAVLFSVLALARSHRGRPWDAMAFAAAPALVLTSMMGWDLLAVALACAALWAWAAGRVTLAGVLAGVGAATAWWPIALAGAVILLCLRERRFAVAGRVGLATVAGFAAVVGPALLAAGSGVSGWLASVSDFDIDDGSSWQLAALDGTLPPAWVEPAGYALVLGAVTTLVLLSPLKPRLPQVAALLLLGALLIEDSHQPQTVLWLLPFVVLARPRWGALLLWQAFELLFVLALAWHQLGYTAAAGEPDVVLRLALFGRMLAEVVLAVLIVRDVLRPSLDTVRAGSAPPPAPRPAPRSASVSSP